MTTLALIEDNDDLRALTEKYLLRKGFSVCAYSAAEDFLESATNADIFIIDINLPDMIGFELVEKLRATDPESCLIILSARERKSDIIRGYDVGADIYLTKPIEPEILLAAINRLASRMAARTARLPAVEVSSTKLTFGECSEAVSQGEVTLLHRLSVAGSRGLERYEIAECLGFDLDTYNSKALEVRVLRLRRKLDKLGLEPGVVETIRGFGYRLRGDTRLVFV